MSIQTVWQKSFDFLRFTPIVVEPSAGALSSDAGLLPIRQFDEQIGLTKGFAQALGDRRYQPFVNHSLLELVRMRIYGILADYEDQRDHMIDPDGGRFTYSYRADGLIDHLANPEGDRTTFTYDSAGLRVSKKLANGTRVSFTHDAAGQMTRLDNLKSDGSTISCFDYTYDDVGNRTHVAEVNGDRVTYSYDNTSQLLAEHRSGLNAIPFN